MCSNVERRTLNRFAPTLAAHAASNAREVSWAARCSCWPPGRESHKARAPIAGIRMALDVSAALELAEQVVDRLLAEATQMR